MISSLLQALACTSFTPPPPPPAQALPCSIPPSHPSSVYSDGFALNIGSDSWQPARVQDAYTAAQQSGTNFKMFISFDMTALPCSSSSDASALQTYVNKYVNNPAQLMYNGKAVFSSFSGSTCQFGTGSVSQGWSSVFGGANVVFIPSFFIDPTQFNSLSSVMGGALNVSFFLLKTNPHKLILRLILFFFLVEWWMAYRPYYQCRSYFHYPGGSNLCP